MKKNKTYYLYKENGMLAGEFFMSNNPNGVIVTDYRTNDANGYKRSFRFMTDAREIYRQMRREGCHIASD